MDDRELEGRLRTHLHRRFDGAAVPADLVENVVRAMTATPRRVGFDLRSRGLRLGWGSIAAVVVIAVALVVGGNLIGPIGPGNRPTATPASSSASQRDFIVLPPLGKPLDKAVDAAAGDILTARIQALGIHNFTSGGGYGIQFSLPAEGPSDEVIRAVLGAVGDVELVPVSPDATAPNVGEAMPDSAHALFGWEGIESVAFDDSQQTPAITITLTPTAREAFGAWTAAHVREYLAVVVDGRVAMLPVINEPIPGGQVTISGGGADAIGRPTDAFTIAAAIMVAGELPEAWRGATVPVIVSRDRAIAAALVATSGGTVQNASATVDQGPLAGSSRLVWAVDVYQPDCPDTGSCVSADLRVLVDAVTGAVIGVGPQE
jgi:hypothetical protein